MSFPDGSAIAADSGKKSHRSIWDLEGAWLETETESEIRPIWSFTLGLTLRERGVDLLLGQDRLKALPEPLDDLDPLADSLAEILGHLCPVAAAAALYTAPVLDRLTFLPLVPVVLKLPVERGESLVEFDTELCEAGELLFCEVGECLEAAEDRGG